MCKNVDSFQLAWDSIEVAVRRRKESLFFEIDKEFTGKLE